MNKRRLLATAKKLRESFTKNDDGLYVAPDGRIFTLEVWSEYGFYAEGHDNHCGTMGCVVGWLPFWFPKQWGEKDGRPIHRASGLYTFDGALYFYNIGHLTAERLFDPHRSWLLKHGYAHPGEVPPEFVASEIEHLVAVDEDVFLAEYNSTVW